MDTDSQAFCDVRLADSPLYFAVLFETPERRERTQNLLSLWIEFDDIFYTCQSIDVARSKYAWWAEELERLQKAEQRHPACRQLLPEQDTQALQQALHLASSRLEYQIFETTEDQLQFHEDHLQALGECLGDTETGSLLTRWQLVHDLQRHEIAITQGVSVLAENLLAKHGVDSEHFHEIDSQTLSKLMLEQIDRLGSLANSHYDLGLNRALVTLLSQQIKHVQKALEQGTKPSHAKTSHWRSLVSTWWAVARA